MNNVELYRDLKRKFWQRYTENILPKLTKYEKERKIRLCLNVFNFICFLTFILGYIAICILDNSPNAERFDPRCLNFIFIAFLISHFIKKPFENKVKRKIMQLVCKSFDNLYWIERYKGTTNYQLAGKLYTIGLSNWYETEKIDDAFVGKHKDVEFDIVEKKCSHRQGKKTVIDFQGVVISFDMNKNFNTHTVIRSDTLMHTTPLENLHHTELEDINFEKKYDVFTDDDVEARYLITPSFMERLNNIELTFKGKISCAFYKEKLILAISTKRDLFSICSLTKPIYDSKQFATMFDEIYSLIELIEYFKLDQKIGL